IMARVDGSQVAVGNEKLMAKQGISAIPCRSGGTSIHVAIDGSYAGHIVIADVIKVQSAEAVAELRSAGVRKLVMLTGDGSQAAQQVAEKLRLDEVHSELLPSDKVAQVERLLAEKPEQEKLAFVGDGINDAPVLTRADVGIAMGAMGSDAAIEAADVVLMDDNPRQVAKAVRLARRCMGIVYQNIALALGIKFICLALGAVGIANMWLAIFADVGVLVIAVLNAIRALQVQNV
ncbi:MAG: HAD-IC family P-type ATPase, partial [Selenomonadaceae bacterium]|nr:HAD-IC family P-type ATPase [Selenomonadaceae bacterium]